MSKSAVFFLALFLLVAGSTALVLAYRATRPPAVVEQGSEQVRELPSEPLEEFELTAQNGKPFNSKELNGKVWVSSFFFASCPATCRRQNEAIARLQEKYGEQGVKFLSISVDPAADTPHVLHTYAEGFKADPDKWYFLTDLSQRIDYIRRVGQDMFKVPVTTQGHADTLILVGRDGAIHDYYNWKKPERILELEQAIEKLLNEPVEEAEEASEPADEEPAETDEPAATETSES